MGEARTKEEQYAAAKTLRDADAYAARLEREIDKIAEAPVRGTLRITGVTCRDGVYFDGKKTLQAKEGALLEIHQQGVLAQMSGRARLLIPFANVLWMQVE